MSELGDLLRLERELHASMSPAHRHQRIVLVGQAPGPRTHPELPLFPYPRNSAGGRLQRYTGLDAAGYLSTFERVNVLFEFPGSSNNNEDLFPLKLARAAAASLKQLLVNRHVILVGSNVAKVFGPEYEAAPLLTWCRSKPARGGCIVFARIPHTSGRSLFWNNQSNRDAALHFFSASMSKIDISTETSPA